VNFCPDALLIWDLYIIKMIGYFKNAMAKLYDAVSAPTSATRDGLSNRLKSIQDITFYYNKAKEQRAPKRTLKEEVEDYV